eukprot:351631-Chlamydomonas_euryale.AAC.4
MLRCLLTGGPATAVHASQQMVLQLREMIAWTLQLWHIVVLEDAFGVRPPTLHNRAATVQAPVVRRGEFCGAHVGTGPWAATAAACHRRDDGRHHASLVLYKAN